MKLMQIVSKAGLEVIPCHEFPKRESAGAIPATPQDEADLKEWRESGNSQKAAEAPKEAVSSTAKGAKEAKKGDSDD